MFNRQTPEYKAWRKNVLNRDGHKCTHCGSTYMLEAHHIKSVAEYPEYALDVDNGITLCKKCHFDIHGRTYSEDILSFIKFNGNLSPLFSTLRDFGNDLSYRMLILRRIWKNLPIPNKARKWLEKCYTELFIGLVIILLANVGNIIECLKKMIQ